MGDKVHGYVYPELKDQVVIVSGGGSGIGQAVVMDLLGNGVRVASFDLSHDETQAKARELDAPGTLECLRVDVSDSASCRSAVDRIHEAHGRIDALLNIAGIAPRTEVPDLTDEIWDRVIRTNLSGTFYLTSAVLRHMIPKKRGRIVNFSSGIARMGRRGQAAYAASKGGVAAFSRTLAHEVHEHGITVNTIFPAADTPMMQREEPMRDMLVGLGLPKPEQLTSGILFWLSDAAEAWTANEMETFLSTPM